MKHHTAAQSPSSRRVNLTAAHLGIPIEARQIDLRSQAERAELGAANPNGECARHDQLLRRRLACSEPLRWG
ncbi:MAG: hypothetical protein JNL83_27105 [Myxococcales bacterium]|nr:hypothetical protein [Myxococcales bacterium]